MAKAKKMEEMEVKAPKKAPAKKKAKAAKKRASR